MTPLAKGLLLVLFLGVMFLLWRILEGRHEKETRKRIHRIKERRKTDTSASSESLRRRQAQTKGLMYWLAKPMPDFKRLGVLLERAGSKLTTQQYVLRRVLSVIAITIVIGFLFKKPFLMAISIGIIIGVWLPYKIIQFQINKYQREFLQLFPDAIDLIVRGLRSGLPVSESLVLVSQEVPDPVKSVFGTVSNTMKLGVPLEKALQETAKKLDISEFNFFTTSILLQRETGGNLSEILNNLSEVLRARILMRLKIKAMSSEARASTMIIGALPFVVVTAVSVLTPGYIAPLFDDYRGNVCLAIAFGMLFFGIYTMRRMSQFEI